MKTENLLLFGALAVGVYFYMKNKTGGGGADYVDRPADQSVQISGRNIPHHLRYQWQRARMASRTHITV